MLHAAAVFALAPFVQPGWFPSDNPGLDSVAACVAVDASGRLLVGTGGRDAPGAPASGLTRWDGIGWEDLPGVLARGAVRLIRPVGAGAMVIAGDFVYGTEEAFSENIAFWDGRAWSFLSGGLGAYGPEQPVWDVMTFGDGRILAGGQFFESEAGVTFGGQAVWGGGAWRGMTPYDGGEVRSFALSPGGEVLACGYFPSLPNVAGHRGWVARWDGARWTAYAPAADGEVRTLHTRPDGGLIAAGVFSSIGGVPARGIARWDGRAWRPLGAGLDEIALAFAEDASGRLITAGAFTTAGGRPAGRIARWDGSAWAPLGDGLDDVVRSVAVLPCGEVVVAGDFTRAGGAISPSFARWSDLAAPPVARHPASVVVESGGTAVLTAAAFDGYAAVSVRWRRGGVLIADGPGGAAAGGGVVSGAAGVLASPTRRSFATLTIAGVTVRDAGSYTAEFVTAAGATVSNPASFVVAGACGADFDADGAVDGADLAVFLACYERGECPPGRLADVDGDGFVDFFDYERFLVLLEEGC